VTIPSTANPTASPNWPDPAASSRSRTDQVASVLGAPVAVAQRVLPASPVPVALGAGALLLAGVVEWPVAGALALGYLALRSWRTRP
jgi:hypothetical protein